jgi:exopolysaccharide biosynthesis polyprenyl glycosylphosphotransferase
MNKMDYRESRLLKIGEMLIDVILVNLGFYLTFMLRYEFHPSARNLNAFIDIIPYISLIALVFFSIYSISTTSRRNFEETIYSVGIALFFIDTAAVAVAFFLRSFAFPRSVFVMGFFIQLLLLLIWKWLIMKLGSLLFRDKDIMVLGDQENTELIVKKLLMDRSPYNIKYVCHEVTRDTYRMMDEVDEVYLHAGMDERVKNKILSYCYDRNKVVYLVPALYDIFVMNSKFEKIDDLVLFKIDNMHLSMEQRFIKRLMDIVISLIVIVITSPLMLVTALLIKLYDKGPVIYSQERVTINNKPFKLYKFRTMVVNAEKDTGPVLAQESDSRITPIGRIIRATRIDELPQFFNVLKGDMSIVGPRPERKCFIDEFVVDVPEFRYRTSVKAGITGLAQVFGKYTTTPADKVKFDLLYIKRASIWQDLKIMLLTLKVMFMKVSATGKSETDGLDHFPGMMGTGEFRNMD